MDELAMQHVSLRFDKSEDYRIREAFKTLRTNIEFSGADLKVICVTSCTPNEGKSSVAMEMAKAFAEAGRKTLLIDADMRKSVLVGRYKTGAVRLGLTHVLVGREKLSDVICSTNFPKLYMVFAGPVPPNPSELLGSESFEALIAKVRELFDMVIVDTPPLGSVIDAAVAAKKCDGTILIIENNSVSYRFAQNVKDQLEKSGSRILGVVLNKVDMSSKSYGHYGGHYGKYYGKYYGNYGSEDSSSNMPDTYEDEIEEISEEEEEVVAPPVTARKTAPAKSGSAAKNAAASKATSSSKTAGTSKSSGTSKTTTASKTTGTGKAAAAAKTASTSSSTTADHTASQEASLEQEVTGKAEPKPKTEPEIETETETTPEVKAPSVKKPTRGPRKNARKAASKATSTGASRKDTGENSGESPKEASGTQAEQKEDAKEPSDSTDTLKTDDLEVIQL